MKKIVIILLLVVSVLLLGAISTEAAPPTMEEPTPVPDSWDSVPVLPVLFSEEGDELVIDKPYLLPEEEVEFLGNEELCEEEAVESVSAEADMDGATVRKDWAQPELYVRDGYDAISAFVTSDTSNEVYDGKVYFVVSANGLWTMFNTRPDAADTFFEKSEDFKGMKVPTKKADTRLDNPFTKGIDESKIPLIARTAFNGMYCNWRKFDDIPFTRDASGNLLYASYLTNEPDEDKKDSSSSSSKSEENDTSKDEEKKDTSSSSSSSSSSDSKSEEDKSTVNPTTPSANSSTDEYWYRYTTVLNSGNTFRVFVTRSVSYTGKKHVLSSAKAGNNKTNDIQVFVYLNGTLVEPRFYSVKFYNSKNCNNYAGSDRKPCLKLKYKFKNKALKRDAKAMERKYYGFDILPLDIGAGTISYRSIYKNGTALKQATFQVNGKTIKLSPPKGDSTGDYSLTHSADGKTTIVGRNNFYNSATIGASSPNQGGASIY